MMDISTVLLLIFFVCAPSLSASEELKPQILEPDAEYNCCEYDLSSSHKEHTNIYCYAGVSREPIINALITVSVVIDLQPNEYKICQGTSVEDVKEQMKSSQKFNHHSQNTFQLNPFNSSCFAIKSSKNYSLTLRINQDLLRMSILIAGIAIFLMSSTLAESPLFYYLAGTSLGICVSVAFIIYLLFKTLSLSKPFMVAALAGSTTIMYFVLGRLYTNAVVIASRYQQYLLGYVLVSGVISFAICYRLGPVTNPRGKNLLKWSLQGVALTAIFFSSHLEKVAFGVIVVVLLYEYNPLKTTQLKVLKDKVGCSRTYKYVKEPLNKIAYQKLYERLQESELDYASRYSKLFQGVSASYKQSIEELISDDSDSANEL